MFQKILKIGLVFVFLFGTLGGIAQASSKAKKIDLDNYEYVPDQLLVSFKPSLGREHANQVLTELGVERIRILEQVGVELLRLPPGLSVEKALEIFSKRAEVLYAEPNYILTIAGSLEAEVVDQWGLNKVEAPLAWQQLPDQTPITIAVVDTGVDPNNPDLLGNIWEDPVEIAGDGIDNDGNGYIDDTWGWDFVNNDNDPIDDQMHGTAVSSVAAGNHDGQGVAGVCPWCKVMAVKVLSAEGSGSLDVAASGIIYAADQGAKIINLSMAAQVGMQTLENAINYAWAAGALVVAAAGNDGAETPIYPATYQNAMSVASTDIDDHHSCFSNYSDGYVSVSAPGSNVTFAYLFGGLKAGSGTSLAAPHVAGLAGLLLSQNPARTNQDLWTLIEESANDLGPVGRDAFFGTGRINAFRAVMGYTTPTTPPDEDFVLVDDPTAYAHARKLARSSDGTLHNVWYDKINGSYLIQYASSSDNGLTWSPPETIFSSTAESYHPALTLDKDTLYVVFPTKSGTTAYHIEFTAKPISGGSWSVPVSIMGGSYNAVRPDIYLDPSNNMLHVVASSLDDSQFVYYRSSVDGGASWAAMKSVDFIYYTRYASVYAYGDRVYIATRMTNGMPLIPTFYLSMMRSLDGGVNWQDRMLFDTHTALTSSEYGLSLTGFEETLFFLYEHNNQIRFGKSTNGVNWDRVIADTNASKWPTITTAPDGKAWLAWVSEGGTVMLQRYLGGQINLSSSYVPTEELYTGKFPNFKEGTNYNRVEWVSTDCNGAPFGLFSDFLDEGSNTPPFGFFDAPASAQTGTTVQFDASASYDPDGDPLTFSWDFGDGNVGSGPTPSHIFQTSGMFPVTLTLTDGNGGLDTATATVDVQQASNQPPTAVIGGPYSGSEDAPINFDGSASSDPNEDQLTFIWNFGDGTVGSGETPSHTYAYGGNFTVTLTVTDGISGEDTAETTVSVQEVNDQPVAVHNGPFAAETGQPIQFDASGSYDADNLDSTPINDQTLSYLWDFGDGSTSSEVSPTHAYATAGEFIISLTVDDGSAQNGSSTVNTSATISETPTSSAHIGDLDGSRITNRNRWIATVTVAVHDDQHSPVAGAVVTGSWSGGFAGTDTCTTNSSGYCSVATDQILKKNPSAVFSIENISHNTLAYNQALNHDPDADSNGTTITVYLDQITDPTPTPTPPPTASDLHIGDLDGEAMTVRSKWAARVFITAHDENEVPLAGVTVTGVWSVGGEASCITDTNGICSITKNNLKTSMPSITFQVTDAALNGYSYLSASNHDPDGDSDGITIIILAP